MKKIIILEIIMFFAIFFISCNQGNHNDGQLKLKQGQVIGILCNADGTRYVEGVNVFVTEDIKKPKIKTYGIYKTNNKGEFIIENVKAGYYSLCIISGQISNKGQPVHLTMPSNEGIDIGKIEATTIIPFQPGVEVRFATFEDGIFENGKFIK